MGERTHWYDSVLAHEAAEWARTKGPATLEEEFRRTVFRAYFVDGRNIADPAVLVEAAGSAGFLPQLLPDLRDALDQHRYRKAVAQQFQEARDLGVTGVPTFVAGGYALVGAHPYEHFQQLMETIGAHPRPAPAE